jgi:hypothetical protein
MPSHSIPVATIRLGSVGIHLDSSDGITAAQSIRRQYGVPTVWSNALDTGHSLKRTKPNDSAGCLEKPFEKYELRHVMVTAFKER